MTKSTLLLATISIFAIFSLYNLYHNIQPQSEALFNAWIEVHSKTYSSVEKEYRKAIWLSNYAYVQTHNAQFQAGQQSYNLQMNLFADLTSQQFGALFLAYNEKKLSNTDKCKGKQAPTTNLPDNVDWAARGAVTYVKNQGQCGSCWAFSATGALQGANKILKNSDLLAFSEQQIVDCSHTYGTNGCSGGLMDEAFFYVIDNGITLESKYPYKGVGGQCQYTAADEAFRIHDCTDVTENQQKPLMAAIAQQPVSVAIQANHLSFQLYKSGVYSGNCGHKLDHGVLAVGYGDQGGKTYYKVKNSWGSSWGANGYIYIARTGDGKGKCGIQRDASFPIV